MRRRALLGIAVAAFALLGQSLHAANSPKRVQLLQSCIVHPAVSQREAATELPKMSTPVREARSGSCSHHGGVSTHLTISPSVYVHEAPDRLLMPRKAVSAPA